MIEIRFARSHEQISQIFNNTIFFSLHLPFVFFVFVGNTNVGLT